jgi:hypothetical protein
MPKITFFRPPKIREILIFVLNNALSFKGSAEKYSCGLLVTTSWGECNDDIWRHPLFLFTSQTLKGHTNQNNTREKTPCEALESLDGLHAYRVFLEHQSKLLNYLVRALLYSTVLQIPPPRWGTGVFGVSRLGRGRPEVLQGEIFFLSKKRGNSI